MKEKDIQRETSQIVEDVLGKANLKQGSIFVLGLSSSEVIGGQIGKESSQEIGEIIVRTILDILEEKGIHLAVQGCEHVNRALVVERQVAEQFGLEMVSVLPTLHAGGSGQLAAFKFMKDPVEVEFIKAHAGLDIGDTAIGMHVYFNRRSFIRCRINPHLVMFPKMKFEPLVDILKTNSSTFELTLTIIPSNLKTNAIILNADD